MGAEDIDDGGGGEGDVDFNVFALCTNRRTIDHRTRCRNDLVNWHWPKRNAIHCRKTNWDHWILCSSRILEFTNLTADEINLLVKCNYCIWNSPMMVFVVVVVHYVRLL